MKKLMELRGKLDKLLWKARFAVAGVMSALTGALFMPLTAFAAPKKDVTDFSFLEKGGTNKGIESITTQVKPVGTSLYRLFFTIGLIGLICSLVIAFFMLGMTKNGQKREENKSWALNIAFAAIGIFGVMTIFGAIKSFAQGIKF